MHGGLKVEVRSTWPGQVAGCVLLRDDGAEIPFTPQPGSHAGRLKEVVHDHPVLHASGHVVVVLVQLGIGLLGNGGGPVGAVRSTASPVRSSRLVVSRYRAQPARVTEDDPLHPGPDHGCPDRLVSVGIRLAGCPCRFPDLSTLTSLLWSWFQDVRIWMLAGIAVFVASREAQRGKERDAPAESSTPSKGERSMVLNAPQATLESTMIDSTGDMPVERMPGAPPRLVAKALQPSELFGTISESASGPQRHRDVSRRPKVFCQGQQIGHGGKSPDPLPGILLQRVTRPRGAVPRPEARMPGTPPHSRLRLSRSSSAPTAISTASNPNRSAFWSRFRGSRPRRSTGWIAIPS